MHPLDFCGFDLYIFYTLGLDRRLITILKVLDKDDQAETYLIGWTKEYIGVTKRYDITR